LDPLGKTAAIVRDKEKPLDIRKHRSKLFFDLSNKNDGKSSSWHETFADAGVWDGGDHLRPFGTILR
jgi:hypothetical protein